MCPLCVSAMGAVVAGAVSSGGMTALLVTVFRRKNAGPDKQEHGELEFSNQEEKEQGA